MQVYCEGRFVGNLNYAVPEGCRQFKFAVLDRDQDLFIDEGMMTPTAVARDYILTIKPRGVNVPIDYGARDPEYQLEIARKTYNIPAEARKDVSRDPMMGGEMHTFRWHALDLDQDTYEQIFDHPAFEPV